MNIPNESRNGVIDEIDEIDDFEELSDPESVTPRRRRAWRPESDDETAALLRQLAATPWLVAGRDDEQIAAVRRNETALRSAVARLGWVLIVERDLVRLRKSPPPRPREWAETGPNPMTCSWFFLLVAAAESMPPRVGLGQLVAGARSAAAEAHLQTTGDMTERRAVVAALRLLDQRGVIQTLDGDLDLYVKDDEAPVLLAVHHSRLTHVVANPGTVDPATDPHRWLELAIAEPEPARRMRRALVDDTCVHAAFVDDAEAQWLSQRVRGDDGAPLAAAFGLVLERRVEGAAFIVPEDAFRYTRELGPLPFPTPGTVAHAALLLCDHAALHGHTRGGPGSGWRGLGTDEVLAALARFAAANKSSKGRWQAELADEPHLLARSVSELLIGLNLLRRYSAELGSAASDGRTRTAIIVDDEIANPEAESGRTWWFAPPTGRWAEAGSATPKTGRHRAAGPRKVSARPDAAAGPSLFDVTAPDDRMLS